MKKKGLIISTVVMVVVLIASLTTATYAWFTASGSAKVDDIQFSVTSASDLLIGVAKNNQLNTNAGWNDFVSDSTQYNTEENPNGWIGTTLGLGLTINHELNLGGMTKAMYSFTDVKYKQADNTVFNADTNPITSAKQTQYSRGNHAINVEKGMVINNTATILKASGNGNQVTASSCEPANKNLDYLDVVFGVAPNKPDVLSFGCLITVDNSQLIKTLGMNAAIHVMYSLNGTNYTEVDIYGTNKAGTVIETMGVPDKQKETIKETADGTTSYEVEYTSTTTLAKGDATLWIPLNTAKHSTDYAKVNEEGLKQLHLIVYICGPDGDCITSATGAGATIKIEFLDINKSMYDKAKAGA